MRAPVRERLCALLRAEGGLIATLVADSSARSRDDGDAVEEAVAEDAARPASPAALAASGPRTQGRREDYELLVEAIFEGYLLHYGRPRVVSAADADLGLLAGDRLYAIGLARLVALGDTLAVAELADTIALSSLAQSAGARELAGAVWTAGAGAVGWGPSDAHRRAKELVLSGSEEALEAMRTCAREAFARPQSGTGNLDSWWQTSAPATSPSTPPTD
jgi:hypothetical protein